MFAAPTKLVLRPRYFLTFLKPSDPSDGPSDDSVVDGELSIVIPSSRSIKQPSIDVELIGSQSLTIKGQYRKHTTLHLKQQLELKAGPVEQGTYTFRYAFVVPANTAPKERLGEFQHDIKRDSITPHGGNCRARTSHRIRATARGHAAFGKDIVEEREIVLQANSNKEGLAEGYSRTEEMLHPALGPLRIRLYTKYLLIHGFLRASIYIPAIQEACTIVDARVVLTQSVRLEDLANPGEVEEVDPYEMTLWRLSDELQHRSGIPMKQGEKLDLKRVMRLPTDNSIRQSTSPWSETGIRVSHKLAVYVAYRLASTGTSTPSKQELMVRFQANISSCDCIAPNVSVPDYKTAISEEGIQRSVSGRPGCLCMLHAGEEEVIQAHALDIDSDDDEEERLGPPGQPMVPKWQQEEEERLGREAMNDLMR